MLRICLVSALACALLTTTLTAQAPKDDPAKKKDAKGDAKKAPPKADKAKAKDAPPPPPTSRPVSSSLREYRGTVVRKDLDNRTVTIRADDRELTFQTTLTTKFVGPREAESEQGLRDERLDVGYEVTVYVDPDAKTVAQ